MALRPVLAETDATLTTRKTSLTDQLKAAKDSLTRAKESKNEDLAFNLESRIAALENQLRQLTKRIEEKKDIETKDKEESAAKTSRLLVLSSVSPAVKHAHATLSRLGLRKAYLEGDLDAVNKALASSAEDVSLPDTLAIWYAVGMPKSNLIQAATQLGLSVRVDA